MGSFARQHGRMGKLAGVLFSLLLQLPGPALAEEAGKAIYLVGEGEDITAVNTQTGQFFVFRFNGREDIERRQVADRVAVLVTNQRFAAIGIWPSGWSSLRRMAGEQLIDIQAQDDSAVITTSVRILSFNGRAGSWSGTRRGLSR